MGERTRRVLVVEDDSAVRRVVTEALEDEGYEVRSATDGRAAIDALQDWRPDLIVLDLIMPDMGGWTFREEQRKIAEVADVPILILSGVHNLPDQAKALEAAAYVQKPSSFEAAMFLAKPFDVDDLLDAVDRLIADGKPGPRG